MSDGNCGKILLRPREVADRLSLGKSTVYQLIERGEIPSVRIGTAVRVPTVALGEWLKGKQSA